jgi:hypothetical protein
MKSGTKKTKVTLAGNLLLRDVTLMSYSDGSELHEKKSLIYATPQEHQVLVCITLCNFTEI